MIYRRNTFNLKFPTLLFACVFVLCMLYIIHDNQQSYLDKFRNDLSQELYAEVKELRRQIRQNGDFWILENYIMGSKKFNYLESITYTTHGEYAFLDNLQEVTKRWQGPISIAIFAPGYDFNRTLSSIQYLRTCTMEKQLIRDLITFHIFFPASHMPSFIPKSQNDLMDLTVNCSEPPPFSFQSNESYRHNQSILYPINVARNIARQSVTTYFVFPCDIEMYPNLNFVSEFLDLTHRKPDLLFNKHQVYTLAVFEVEQHEEIPITKTDLQEMIHTGKALPFHKKVCMYCHAIPNLDIWIKKKETAQLDIFSNVKHRALWEPFYVTTNFEPTFDERYTWEGRYDKQIQADLLGMMNYTFCILDNAFLVHRPGIKHHADKSTPEVAKMRSRTSEITKQLKILYV